jgi:hypothetical protein
MSMVAEQQGEIEMIEVKAEDIIGERRAMYDAFIKMVPVAIGLTIVTLVGIYVFWG